MSSRADAQVESSADPSARHVVWPAVLLLALAGGTFVRFGRLNHDEGWYLYAARLVYEGQWLYRDFPFYQAPLLPYLYGLPQLVVPGVETGRWTSFAISIATCAIALRLAHARGGRFAVGVVALGILGSPLALWTLNSTRTEPLCAFFLVSAIACLNADRERAGFGALAALLGVLAAMTRISLLPAAIVIAIWACWRFAKTGSEIVRVLAPAAVGFVLLAALAMSGGLERAWANLIEIQAQREMQFRSIGGMSLEGWIRTRFHFFVRVWNEFGSITVFAGIAAIGLFVANAIWPKTSADERDERRSIGAGTAVIAIAAIVPNLIPRAAYTVYFTSVLPIVLVAGGWGVAALRDWLAQQEFDRRVVIGVACACVLGVGLAQARVATGGWLAWISTGPSDLVLLRDAARSVEAKLPGESALLTFDTYLAVETGRSVPGGFEMGVFSWFPRRPEADGERLGVLTNDRLEAAFASPDIAHLALSDVSLGVLAARRHNGFRPRQKLDEAALHAAHPPLRRFELVETIGTFGQLQAPLYLMRARDAAPQRR